MTDDARSTSLDWELITTAPWRPRDSHGDVVHDGRLWVLGGWHAADEPNGRDVWSSADGRDWELITEQAPWEYSDLPVSVTFDKRLWMMGGRRLPGAANTNQVWASADGRDWELITPAAGWSPRVGAAHAVFDDRVWVLGGTENFYDDSEANLRNDVWASADGESWELVCADAPWPARAHAQAVSFAGRLWLLGGGTVQPRSAHNDVWSTADGVHWQRHADAGWAPRMWAGVAVDDDRIWVSGGHSQQCGNHGDVWSSPDGDTWTELVTESVWSPRHEHSLLSHDGALWVLGGYADVLSGEVWRLGGAAD
ncbi:Kelch repeat-containing protein [Microlunatus sp. Y2014]|uniref:Kelch repeat-containing protein n=1 Tax=Microlunatus sp. Y2014 TaxID=3418488 RepID=UPI003DA72E89